MTFTPPTRDSSAAAGLVASIPGPAVGPVRAFRRRSWWAPAVETLIITVMAIGFSMILRHEWMRNGAGTWDTIRQVLNDREQFTAAGSALLTVIPVLIAVRLISGVVVRGWFDTGRGERQSVRYDDLDRIEAVARYHAALAAGLSALRITVREISLRDHIQADTLHAGTTSVRWHHLDGTNVTDGARLWAVLVATIAATINQRQATGDDTPIRAAEWADSELAALHTLAIRTVLYAERPDEVVGDWNTTSALRAAEARARDILATHRNQIDALTAVIVTNFLGITPREVTAEQVQQCLTTPENVLNDRDYAYRERPPVTTYARTVAIGCLGIAGVVVAVALFAPMGSDGVAFGALEVTIVAAIAVLRYGGRTIATRIGDDLSYLLHRRATRTVLAEQECPS